MSRTATVKFKNGSMMMARTTPQPNAIEANIPLAKDQMLCDSCSGVINEHDDHFTAEDGCTYHNTEACKPRWFRNYYKHCGEKWSDDWTATCDDECPKCGHDISPYKSDDIDGKDGNILK